MLAVTITLHTQFGIPQFISSSNLALTFDAANSTCTAACTTCSDTSNADTNQYNTDEPLLDELLNTLRNKTENGWYHFFSLSHIKETATSNAGTIKTLSCYTMTHLLLPSLLSLFLVKRLRTNNQTVLLVYIYWQLMMELNIFIVLWRSCVVQEDDGQD